MRYQISKEGLRPSQDRAGPLVETANDWNHDHHLPHHVENGTKKYFLLMFALWLIIPVNNFLVMLGQPLPSTMAQTQNLFIHSTMLYH